MRACTCISLKLIVFQTLFKFFYIYFLSNFFSERRFISYIKNFFFSGNV